MPVRLKNGRQVSSVDRRRSYGGVPVRLPQESHYNDASTELGILSTWHRRVVADRLVIALEKAAKDMTVELFSARERKATKQRIHRATRSLAATPDGRALLTSAAARLASPVVAGTLRELARSLSEDVTGGPRSIVAQLQDAVVMAEQVVTDFDVTCPTALDWTLSYGLWKARETQTNGRASALRTDTRSITIRQKDGTISAAIFKDTVALADKAASRSEYCLRLVWEIEDRWRAEEAARARARQAAHWAAAQTTALPELPEATTEPSEPSTETVAETALDAAEIERHELPEERAREPEEPAGPVLPEREWCGIRQRFCPPAIANSPRPSAALGSHWPELVAEEERALRDFDQRVAIALRSGRRKR